MTATLSPFRSWPVVPQPSTRLPLFFRGPSTPAGYPPLSLPFQPFFQRTNVPDVVASTRVRAFHKSQLPEDTYSRPLNLKIPPPVPVDERLLSSDPPSIRSSFHVFEFILFKRTTINSRRAAIKIKNREKIAR